VRGFPTGRVSGITFIRYAQNRKIGKPNNLKFWEQKKVLPTFWAKNQKKMNLEHGRRKCSIKQEV
jgi:hypothetical protein